MKRIVIAALVFVNIALVLAMVFGTNQQPAKAQARGNADYIAVTAKVSTNVDAIYIIDLTRQRMLAFEPDPNNKGKLAAYRGVEFKNDFKLREE